MILDGSVSVARRTGHEGTTISLTIIDSASGKQVVDVEMSAEAFGDAITGLARQKAVLRINRENLDLLGMVREVKREVVLGRFSSRTRTQEVLVPYEVDGWRADVRSAMNPHNWTHKDGERATTVTFRRWLKNAAEWEGEG